MGRIEVRALSPINPGGGAGGGISGSGTSGQVAYWDGVDSITSDSGLTWDGSIFGATAYKTQAATVASTGAFRLGNAQGFYWRDSEDASDASLTFGSSEEWVFALNKAQAASVILQQNDNSSGSAHAKFYALTGGTSGGDPYFYMAVSGATQWAMGLDNSDSDSFKISQNGTLGTNDRLILTTAGDLTIQSSTGNRFGTNAIIIGSDTEANSFLGALSAVPASTFYAHVVRGSLTTTSASSIQLAGGYSDFLRVVTSSVTDTANVFGHQFRVSTNISNGQTYTNTGNAGLIAVRISSYNPLGSGTYAGDYFGIQYGGESASTTGRKVALNFNSFAGGSLGNCKISDNVAFSGDWSINLTAALPSLISGLNISSVSGNKLTLYTPSASTSTALEIQGGANSGSSAGGNIILRGGARGGSAEQGVVLIGGNSTAGTRACFGVETDGTGFLGYDYAAGAYKRFGNIYVKNGVEMRNSGGSGSGIGLSQDGTSAFLTFFRSTSSSGMQLQGLYHSVLGIYTEGGTLAFNFGRWDGSGSNFGEFWLMKSSGAHIKWNTDGAGVIGDDSNAPDAITVKTYAKLRGINDTARDALTASNGMLIYNTTSNKFQGRASGAWVDLH